MGINARNQIKQGRKSLESLISDLGCTYHPDRGRDGKQTVAAAIGPDDYFLKLPV
jgi:hypothetical protein